MSLPELTLSPEQFALWLSPRATVEKLRSAGFAEQDARHAIVDRLVRGALPAVAYRAFTWLLGEMVWDFWRIPRTNWAGIDLGPDFWAKGDVDFPGSKSASVLTTPRAVSCVSVRFDVIGVDLILEQAVPLRSSRASHVSRAPPPITPLSGQGYAKPKAPHVHPGTRTTAKSTGAARQRVPPPYAARHVEPATEKPRKVTKDELRQWFPLYERASSDFSEGTVRNAAAKHFRPRPVSRQPVRDIIAEFERTLTRGKPSRT